MDGEGILLQYQSSWKEELLSKEKFVNFKDKIIGIFLYETINSVQLRKKNSKI